MELAETRRVLEELTRESQQKSRECQEDWTSLKELKIELMRKSMHHLLLKDEREKQVDFDTKRLDKESEVSQELESHENLKFKYIEWAKERIELYNKVLELQGKQGTRKLLLKLGLVRVFRLLLQLFFLTGNIRVFCRCRPLNDEEIKAGAAMAVDIDYAKHGELTVMSNGASRKNFKFDAVFGPKADQGENFEDTAPCATSVPDEYNVCIFAYGRTRTGKTFTVEGTEEARGVNFRTLEKMFDIITERQNLYYYDVPVSVLEVYNEQMQDLLVSGNQLGIAARRLEIRQAGEGMHHVPGLVGACVENMTEVWDVLQTDSNARAVSSTNANEHSSQSHCIHCVMVKGENLLNGESTRSKLWLVDLAGSEQVAKTEVKGEWLKKTQNIYRSLSALGDVISALATISPHIPFRNSKRTHLLQDSSGGDSKTRMFVQIIPNKHDLGETICSLNLASRLRGIELGPAKRQLDSTDLQKYLLMAEKTRQDVKIKEKTEDTIEGLDLKIKERDIKTKNLQGKVKELEAQFLIERKLARQYMCHCA